MLQELVINKVAMLITLYLVLYEMWDACILISFSQQGCEVGARYILAMKKLNLREGSTMLSASLSLSLEPGLGPNR